MNLNKKTTLNKPCIASGEIHLIRDSEIIYRKYSPKTTMSPKSLLEIMCKAAIGLNQDLREIFP
jgi:hypothetical protein